MKVVNLIQGTPEWHAHRRTTRNASDAPAMMGVSPYVKRSDLVRRYATGIEEEIDASTQARFDRGHEVEPALRAQAEAEIGEDLYPVTATSDDGYLGASFDGVSLAEHIILEAKQPNAQKFVCIDRSEIPPVDYWQIVQQFAVCESAASCIYKVGDGTAEGTKTLVIQRESIEHDIPTLIAGWKQFDADVAAYQPEEAPAVVAVGRAPEQLPSLRIEVTGMVTHSNLEEFKEQAFAVLAAIPRDLQTDEDFANAEQTVKWCKGVEERLEGKKQDVLSQTASIEAVFRTIDEVAAETRRIRLELDKAVSREKELRKMEIVQRGVEQVRIHYAEINQTMGEHRIQPPQSLQMDIGSVIKGKKSLTSMKDAVDSAVAGAKVAASQLAEKVRVNVAILGEHPDHAALFADRVALCATKAPEDLRNLVATRIAEHEQREAERLERERERIRQEEADRIKREQATQAASPPAKAASKAPEPSSPAPTTAPAQYSMPSVATLPAAASSAQLKLGDINAALSPLTITADGLASLGFQPVGSRGAARLYAGADFPAICAKLQQVIANAPARLPEREAA